MPAGRLFYIFGAFLLIIAFGTRLSPARENQKAAKKLRILLCLVGMLVLIWGACGGFYSIYMFSDRIQSHRSLNSDAVIGIEVLPSRNRELHPSLVSQEVLVTDRQQIRQIVRAIIAGEPWAPNHPDDIWNCILRFDDGTQKHSYRLSATTNNGVLIEVFSEGDQGLLLGVYREDSLKEVLEAIATAKQSSEVAARVYDNRMK